MNGTKDKSINEEPANWEDFVHDHLDDILWGTLNFEITEATGIESHFIEACLNFMSKDSYLRTIYDMAKRKGNSRSDIAAVISVFPPSRFGFDDDKFLFDKKR